MSKLDRLIIENQSVDGSIDISDQSAMRDEIKLLFLDLIIESSDTDAAKMIDMLRTKIGEL